ncbi:ShlB/FhaC/HecB family hemolysin secretion/activation protein [uncultured Sneathia sp.]|uniref:ShlB/FhaC/HecB family hemolysin secretion/activation protein n=1 Tax=uncultured Sneathia sp. TaxID=278067 RepID=UPI002597E6B6|nr:ShlB/FhaC/HecB family hemolysin secretion/activation protein [uncultured Sneathia sp.]
MKKILLFLLFPYILSAKNILISDKYNILDEKYLSFENEEDLKRELNKLTLEMLNKGYVSSQITQVNGEICVKPGYINKVILKEANANIKKKLLGLESLEGKILNISDVDKIVSEYERLENNDIKIEIRKTPNKDFYSDIIVNNTAKRKLKFGVVASYTDKFKYNVNLSILQPFYLNDKFSTNFSILNKSKYVGLSYSLPIHSSVIDLSYFYTTQKINEYGNSTSHEVSLSVSKDLYKDKLKNLSLETSTKLNISNDYVSDIKIKDKIYFDNDVNLEYNNVHVFKNSILNTNLQTKVGLGYMYNKEFKTQHFPVTFDVNANFKTKYLDNTTQVFASLNNNNDSRYMFSKDINSINDIPLNITDSSYVLSTCFTLKYPVTEKDILLQPFVQLAGCVAKGEKKYINLGMGIGIDVRIKDVFAKLKYSIDKEKNKSLGIQIGINK